MNPLSRTLAYAGTAGLTALLAFAAWSFSQPSSVEGFAEVGQAFFPDFDEATAATALTVVDYDGEEKDAQEFAVKQNDDGLWVIPSHHDYPAEAEDRLAKTATSLLGVEKTAVQSRNKDDWKLYGVVDPAAKGTETAEERGTRLTLSDGSDNALVDLIIGNEVEGRDGNYYVREPEKNTTYIAQLDVDLSAKFSDWIEPDLLKINSSDLVKIVLDNYSVDEQRGVIEKKEMLEFTKADLKTSGDWTLAELNEEAEELDKSPVTSIATNLDQLKIVGVRPKPEGMDDNLRINPAVKQILQMQMQAQGYFIGGDKEGKERLYANEGELVAGTSNGVEYTLFFGEIARGTGKDIEVGLKQDAAAKDEKKDGDDSESTDEADDSPDEEDGPRRYLMVKTTFNEALLGPKPVAPEEPVKPEILKEETKPEEKAEAKDEQKDAAKAVPKKEEKSEDEPKEEAPQKEATESEESEADDSCGPQDEPVEKATEETPSSDEPATDEPAQKETNSKAEDKPEPPSENNKEEAAAKEKSDKEPPAKDEKSEDAKAAKPDEKKAEPASKADKAEPKPDEKKADPEAPADDSKKEDAEPEEPEKDPKQVAQEAYDAAVSKYEADKRTYESDLKAFEDKVKQGKEKAEELSRRFAGWYYVISSDSFEKFRITRNDVVSKKEAEEEAKDDEAETDK